MFLEVISFEIRLQQLEFLIIYIFKIETSLKKTSSNNLLKYVILSFMCCKEQKQKSV